MSQFSTNYTNYYGRYVKKFCDDLSQWPTSDFEGMPKPFIPLFGDCYESSRLRIAFIGIDSLFWDDLPTFLADVPSQTEVLLAKDLDWFWKEVPFLDWNPRTRYKFWGFILYFLAKINGIDDWRLLKRDKTEKIIRSFAWGNSNSIEFYHSSAQKEGVPIEVWRRAKQASEPLDRLKHVIATLAPQVVVIMNRGLDTGSYFKGLTIHEEETRGGIVHYRVGSQGTHVFHFCHPRGMIRDGAGEHYAFTLSEMFRDNHLSVDFPDNISLDHEWDNFKAYILAHAPRPDIDDKFECVRWISHELLLRNSVMSVPSLAEILNQLGYCTNYGTPYEGSRGTYRLVKFAYDHNMARHGDEAAATIAEAFVRPNGEYAY